MSKLLKTFGKYFKSSKFPNLTIYMFIHDFFLHSTDNLSEINLVCREEGEGGGGGGGEGVSLNNWMSKVLLKAVLSFSSTVHNFAGTTKNYQNCKTSTHSVQTIHECELEPLNMIFPF